MKDRRIYPLHRRDEAISVTSNGLNKARRFGGVVQRLAQAANGGIETVVKVNERVRWPQLPAQFLARNDLAGSLQQADQDLKRLLLQPDL
jgi:hypothetical protein